MDASAAEGSPPSAVIRRRPEDFVVEELPAYAPSGRGEHLFITLRKTGLTTPDAVRALARALEVDPRGAGHAGMKDRHAVTTQTVSLPFPIARDADAALAGVKLPGVELVSWARHDHKLKPGHLAGNRFTLVLREVTAPGAIAERLRELAREGVPNAFGPQRFGRDGDNATRALAWLAGTERGPRDRHEQRLVFSALQSWLYNQLLARRVADGTWSAILPGDLAKKIEPPGGLFAVPLDGPELDDARARAAAGAIAPTGPMYGATMRWPEGAPLAMEREVLASAGIELARLEAFQKLGEGTRRALRMPVHEVSVMELGDVESSGRLPDLGPAVGPGEAGAPRAAGPDRAPSGLCVSFVLPKGGYATTVLASACRVIDATRSGDARGGPDPGPEE